jgi:hypothetical protein
MGIGFWGKAWRSVAKCGIQPNSKFVRCLLKPIEREREREGKRKSLFTHGLVFFFVVVLVCVCVYIYFWIDPAGCCSFEAWKGKKEERGVRRDLFSVLSGGGNNSRSSPAARVPYRVTIYLCRAPAAASMRQYAHSQLGTWLQAPNRPNTWLADW